MSITAPELDYSKYTFSHGSYRFHQLTQETGGTTVTVTTAGGQESIFQCPPKAYNYSKAVLRFTATPTSAGANNYNWMYLCIPFREIQFYGQNGPRIVDLQHAHRYWDALARQMVKLEDMLDMEPNIASGSLFEGLARTNQLTSSAVSTRPDYDSAYVSYTEAQYVVVGGAAATTPVLNYQFRLGLLKDTFLGIDRDTYFDQIMYLRFVWLPSTQLGFYGTSATNPTTGAAALAQSVAISNLKLYMPVEQNPLIEADLKSKVSADSGMSLLMPYVHAQKQTLSSATQTPTVKLNRIHGQKLLKFIWSPYHVTESSNTAYNNSCLADAKITEFYIEVNGDRTTNFNVDTSAFDDYLIKKDRLKGSCIQSADEFQFKWCWVEDFTDNSSMTDKPFAPPQVNYIDGISLDSEVQIDVYGTTAGNNLNHYLFAVCQRELVIRSGGVIQIV